MNRGYDMKKVYMTITLVLLLGGYLMTVGYGDEEATEEAIWRHVLGDEEPIWGNTFQDLAISVSPRKDRYTLGEDIEILVLTKNFGENEAHLYRKRGFFNNFRLGLFDADGRPVAKSEYRAKLETSIGQVPTGYMSGSTMEIGPGRMASGYGSFSLNEWFKIEKEGTYSLVVMRAISSWDWDKGFLISNAAKIIITNSENPSAPDQHHTPQEDNILGQDRLEAGKYVVIGGLCAILIVGCIALLKKANSRGKSRAT